MWIDNLNFGKKKVCITIEVILQVSLWITLEIREPLLFRIILNVIEAVEKESCSNNNSGNHSNVIKNIIVEINKHNINIIVIIIIIIVPFKTLFKMCWKRIVL